MKPYRLRSNNEGWLMSYADLITNLLIFFVLIIAASSIQTGKMEQIASALSQSSSEGSLVDAEQKVQHELLRQELAEDVRVQLTDAGLEIIFDSGVMFPSGSAVILSSMNEPLQRVLEVILPYTERYQLALEGHTDERPISSNQYPSNWELASARAMQVRERLEAVGVDSRIIRVEAYADNKPLPPEWGMGLDRETFLAKHRRVVIRLF